MLVQQVRVNGVPCELSVDPARGVLAWARRTGGNQWRRGLLRGRNTDSSVGRLVRRLSNGSLSTNASTVTVATSQTNDLPTYGLAHHVESSATDPDKAQNSGQSGKRREIDLDLVIAVERIQQRASALRGDRRGIGRHWSGGTGDGTKLEKPGKFKYCASGEVSAGSQHQDCVERQAVQGKWEPAEALPTRKLKIYYVKRNDGGSRSGRLLKLKKMTVGLSSAKVPHQMKALAANQTGNLCDTTNRAGLALLGHLYDSLERQISLRRAQRPGRLLVFVNPFGGKGRAVRLFEAKVRRILDLAGVECQLVVTNHANHARETLEDPEFNVDFFDGIICVGGDGMFAELMNGLLFRFNRHKLFSKDLDRLGRRLAASSGYGAEDDNGNPKQPVLGGSARETKFRDQLNLLRSSLGGIGERFCSPPIPIGVIGAGSTDANLFGLIGTNDVISATLNIILGNQIQIDVASVHSIQDDRLLRFVSTFVAYGYFGDVVRESEQLRWLGPSRYDVTAINSLIKYRNYEGLVRILSSSRDGSPHDLERCHLNCSLCQAGSGKGEPIATGRTITNNSLSFNDFSQLGSSYSVTSSGPSSASSMASGSLGRIARQAPLECGSMSSSELIKGQAVEHRTVGACSNNQLSRVDDETLELIERRGSFMGVNAAVMACRCPQTKKGFSPSNHLANGCADLVLVRPCTRLQYINYLIRTGYTKKSAFDLKYVEAFRCRQFEFVVRTQRKQRQSSQQINQDHPNDIEPNRQQQQAYNELDKNRSGINNDENDNSTRGFESSTATLEHSNSISTVSSRSCEGGPAGSNSKKQQPQRQQQQPKGQATQSDKGNNHEQWAQNDKNGSKNEPVSEKIHPDSVATTAQSRHEQVTAEINFKPTRDQKLQLSGSNVDIDSDDDGGSNSTIYSSWNADGEILQEQSIRVKVNQQLLRVFGTGEP